MSSSGSTRVQTMATPPTVAFALLALSAWLLWAGQAPAAKNVQKTTPVPTQLGPWMGHAIAVDHRAVEILETDDVSLMEYRLSSHEPPVWLARVAGFGNRAAFHPPELCYVGSHFEVLERGPISVMVNGKIRQVMRLVIAQGHDKFEAWYWFTASGQMTPNYYQQQLWLLRGTIRRRPTSGMLVRISTPLDSPEQTHRRLLAFVISWDATPETAQADHGA